MCGVAAASTLLVLAFQERSLAHGLERAALERLDRATRAAERLTAGHLESMAERYRTVAATPQVRATLELGDEPTTRHLAEALLAQQGAVRILFLDPAGQALGGTGAEALDADAMKLPEAGLLARGGRVFATVRVPVSVADEPLATLLALEPVSDALLADWSERCGARITVEPRDQVTRQRLHRVVQALGELELRASSDFDAERRAMADARFQLALAGALGLLLAFGASLWLARGLVEPILQLKAAAERVGSGDLTGEIERSGPEEIRDVAGSFASMATSLRSTVARVAGAADRVEATAGQIAGISDRLGRVVSEQTAGQARAAESMRRINEQVDGIFESAAESAEALDIAVDGSSQSFRQLERTGAELAGTADGLQEETEAIGSAIDQMARTGVEVARQTDALLPAVDTTAAAMLQMERSAREVSTGAKDAAALSRNVIESADRGQSHVLQTVGSMEEIREATHEAEQAVQELGRGVREIGAFLTEIDEVADESALLALNASIIAAQAGEHGRAFAVVADQMKELADRVMGGTQEIYRLVSTVQGGMSRAVGAIEKGTQRVASGVERAELAGRSLEEITGAARRTGEKMAVIATATAQQTQSASAVSRAMEQVRSGVETIRAAGQEQSRGNVLVQRSAESLRDVAGRVRAAIAAQTQGTGRIGSSIETVHKSVVEINRALREQLEACREASRMLEGLEQHTRATETATAEIGGASRDLVGEAEDLRSDVRGFRV
jgi:methyl-accepting chemotaxis protein